MQSSKNAPRGNGYGIRRPSHGDSQDPDAVPSERESDGVPQYYYVDNDRGRDGVSYYVDADDDSEVVLHPPHVPQRQRGLENGHRLSGAQHLSGFASVPHHPMRGDPFPVPVPRVVRSASFGAPTYFQTPQSEAAPAASVRNLRAVRPPSERYRLLDRALRRSLAPPSHSSTTQLSTLRVLAILIVAALAGLGLVFLRRTSRDASPGTLAGYYASLLGSGGVRAEPHRRRDVISSSGTSGSSDGGIPLSHPVEDDHPGRVPAVAAVKSRPGSNNLVRRDEGGRDGAAASSLDPVRAMPGRPNPERRAGGTGDAPSGGTGDAPSSSSSSGSAPVAHAASAAWSCTAIANGSAGAARRKCSGVDGLREGRRGYIHLVSVREGMSAWTHVLYEVLELARRLNRTLVEPCVAGGEIVPCVPGRVLRVPGSLSAARGAPVTAYADPLRVPAFLSHCGTAGKSRGVAKRDNRAYPLSLYLDVAALRTSVWKHIIPYDAWVAQELCGGCSAELAWDGRRTMVDRGYCIAWGPRAAQIDTPWCGADQGRYVFDSVWAPRLMPDSMPSWVREGRFAGHMSYYESELAGDARRNIFLFNVWKGSFAPLGTHAKRAPRFNDIHEAAVAAWISERLGVAAPQYAAFHWRSEQVPEALLPGCAEALAKAAAPVIDAVRGPESVGAVLVSDIPADANPCKMWREYYAVNRDASAPRRAVATLLAAGMVKYDADHPAVDAGVLSIRDFLIATRSHYYITCSGGDPAGKCRSCFRADSKFVSRVLAVRRAARLSSFSRWFDLSTRALFSLAVGPPALWVNRTQSSRDSAVPKTAQQQGKHAGSGLGRWEPPAGSFVEMRGAGAAIPAAPLHAHAGDSELSAELDDASHKKQRHSDDAMLDGVGGGSEAQARSVGESGRAASNRRRRRDDNTALAAALALQLQQLVASQLQASNRAGPGHEVEDDAEVNDSVHARVAVVSSPGVTTSTAQLHPERSTASAIHDAGDESVDDAMDDHSEEPQESPSIHVTKTAPGHDEAADINVDVARSTLNAALPAPLVNRETDTEAPVAFKPVETNRAIAEPVASRSQLATVAASTTSAVPSTAADITRS